MKLCEAEPLCAFDHHDRGVGDVDTDLDDRRRDEDRDIAALEPAHDGIAFGRLHPTVK